MQFILYPDVFQAIIASKFDNVSHKRTVDAILNNQDSVVVYSKKMLELLRQEISDDDNLSYQALVTKLSDEGKNFKSSDTSKSIEDEINHLNKIASSNVVLNIAYKGFTEQSLVGKVAVIAKQNKPNYHWLICNLAVASPNKVTVNCHDFNNNKDIESFFSEVFSLCKNLTPVNIFDTQCNVAHNIFNHIIGKSQVNYYTKRGSNRNFTDEDNYESIKSKFVSNFRMYIVAARRAHARRVIVDEIVVTCDNDYWNLVVDGQDWSVDVQISKDDASNWLKRTALYSQFFSRVRR